MTEQEIRARMDEAFREDRERFFRVADSIHLQPRYAEHLEELEQVKQQWRDMPSQPDYPNFTHPVALPSWFPPIKLCSSWEKDIYITETLARVRLFSGEE